MLARVSKAHLILAARTLLEYKYPSTKSIVQEKQLFFPKHFISIRVSIVLSRWELDLSQLWSPHLFFKVVSKFREGATYEKSIAKVRVRVGTVASTNHYEQNTN